MPEFTPTILSSTINEDEGDELIDVYREWYEGLDYLDNLQALGVPNARYNFGGGLEYSTRGGYDVKWQGPNGYYYSRNNSGALEKLDEDFFVVEQTDFAVGGEFPDLQMLGNGYILDAQLTLSNVIEVRFIDTETMDYVRNQPTGGAPYKLEIPDNLSGFCFRPEDNALYYHASRNTLDSGFETILGRLVFDGAPNGTPQVDWERNLRNNRNYLGEGVQDIFYYDGSLYSYNEGIILEYNPNNGKIISRDNFSGQLPSDVDFADNRGNQPRSTEDLQVHPDGELHILIEYLSPLEWNDGTAAGEEREILNNNIYLTYDLDAGEVVRDVETYDGVEGASLNITQREDVDGDGNFESLDLKGRYQFDDLLEQEPYADHPDNISQFHLTPYGYVLEIDSDILPRFEMHSYDTDEVMWRVYSALFDYGGGNISTGQDFNHRQYAAVSQEFVDEAYPMYEFSPQLWDSPSRNTNSVAQNPTSLIAQAGVIPESLKEADVDLVQEGDITKDDFYSNDDATSDKYVVLDQDEDPFSRYYAPDVEYVFHAQGDGLFARYRVVSRRSADEGGSSGDKITFRKATNVAVANTGVVREASSTKAVASTSATISSFGQVRVVATPKFIKPQVGILGGGERIDGGTPAPETNTLYDYVDSEIINVNVSVKQSALNGDYFANVALTPVSATTTAVQGIAYTATIANPSLVRVSSSINDTTTIGNAVHKDTPQQVRVELLGGAEDYWRKRTLTVGETTDIETTID